ncbi:MULTISPECIES: DUF4212 domain-containing protein [Bordetella]|uniref:Sodium symporter small subunit domain-containing protein n=1 Tax=Bordetella genomosp. 6 TaxID=463024 RepID=A0ABX4FFU8_9BORD|nr:MULTISPECIES: DUF4212 domain-containing protein [Bordetella]AOB28063.1 hypothetical protein BBB44_18300 [Bordetella bronchiseptica]ARP75592.1 hypothetical protein CAL11_05310 [Bordetella genomosp. 6]AZW45399.1 DUF4212 domain-containing protein [Bordetella bronchiseptica]MBN3266336.1 DUF4212 domain-containing protein [Bordetella bronchiseptica]OZI81080.1 hypothetical protein CAL23_05000 [Bordetella genomosp. 6]
MPESRVNSEPSPAPYWRRNVRLIVLLLACWAGLTFVPAYFARQLAFDFIGWPFSFWMAAYGAPLAYLVLIVVYALVMNRFDARSRARRDD